MNKAEFVSGLHDLATKRPHWVPAIRYKMDTEYVKPFDFQEAVLTSAEADVTFQILSSHDVSAADQQENNNTHGLRKHVIIVFLAIVGHMDQLDLKQVQDEWQLFAAGDVVSAELPTLCVCSLFEMRGCRWLKKNFREHCSGPSLSALSGSLESGQLLLT